MILAPGKYLANCKAWQVGRSKNGTEQIELIMHVAQNDPCVEARGSWIRAFLYFSEATEERSVGSLEYLGWDGTTPIQLDPSRTVEIVVEDEVYDGQARAKVKWINRVASAEVITEDKMSDREQLAFGQRLRGLMKKPREPKRFEPTQTAPDYGAPPLSEDDYRVRSSPKGAKGV